MAENPPQNSCIIVDDEPGSRFVLKELLGRFCPEMSVVAECEDIHSGEIAIHLKKPNLVFLDIQMPGGNGFDLLKKFTHPHFDVIFLTSYDEYAIRAIKFNALDYLLKPVDIDELIAAIQKHKHKTWKFGNEILLKQVAHFDHAKPKMAFHLRDKVELIDIDQILFFDADVNYSKAYIEGGTTLIQAKSLGEMENLLKGFNQFIRIHKSQIINTKHVISYTKHEPYLITLSSGHSFEISRRRKSELLTMLQKITLKN